MNSANPLNASDLMMETMFMTDNTQTSTLTLSASNGFPAMNVQHAALDTSTITAPYLLGVTAHNPDILAMCSNSLKPVEMVFNGSEDGSEITTSSRRDVNALTEKKLASTTVDISCISDAIANDWEVLTSDMSLQAETLKHLGSSSVKIQSKQISDLDQVSLVRISDTKASVDEVDQSQSEINVGPTECIPDAQEVITADKDSRVAIVEDDEDLDLFVEDCGVNDINSTIIPHLSKVDDDVESVHEDDSAIRNIVKTTTNKKGKSSKDAKLSVIASEDKVNGRPKRSAPRRSVFELLQGEMRTTPSVTTKRRNSASSDVEEDTSATKSLQLFSGYGSSDEDKPSKKQRKHTSSTGVTRCRVPRRPNFDYDVDPVYSADDFGEFNMEIVVEPTTVASDVNKSTEAALFSLGSTLDTGKGNQSDSLWSTPVDSKNSPLIAEPALEKLNVTPGITIGIESTSVDQLSSSTLTSIPFEDNRTEIPAIDHLDVSLIDKQENPAKDHREIPSIDKVSIADSSTVPWLAAAMGKEARLDDTVQVPPCSDKMTTLDTEIKEKQKQSSSIVVQPIKKFNIDPHTRKFIRIRDTTGCSSSAGKLPASSVMGGVSDSEKEIKRLAVILKTKEAKLCALDRELDERAVNIKLIEGRVVRRERALKDTEKSLEYRERMLRNAEADARAKRGELNINSVVSAGSQNKEISVDSSNVYNVESRFEPETSLGGIQAAARVAEKQDELDRLRQRLIDERELILSNEQRLARWEVELQQRQNEFDEKKRSMKKNKSEGGSDGAFIRGASDHKSGRPATTHSKSSISVHKHIRKLVSNSVTNGGLSKNKSTTLPAGKDRRVNAEIDLVTKKKKSTSNKVVKTH